MIDTPQHVSMSAAQYLRFECTIDYIPTPLSANDTELLSTFLARPNTAISMEDLTTLLWPDEDGIPDWEHDEILQRIVALKERHCLTGLRQRDDRHWIFYPLGSGDPD